MARMAISGWRWPRGLAVGDGGQVGEQVWGLGLLERVGITQRGQPDGIGNEGSGGTGFHRGHEAMGTP
jgi:hypothetical protein